MHGFAAYVSLTYYLRTSPSKIIFSNSCFTFLECSPENRDRLVEDLTRADAVVLTYACDRPDTLDRLSTHWLPELRRLEVL